MSDTEVKELKKEIRDLRRDVRALLQRFATSPATADEWITGRQMAQRSGMSKEQLRYWREHNPGLWHPRITGKVDSLERTVRRGITYNWTAYQASLKPAENKFVTGARK